MTRVSFNIDGAPGEIRDMRRLERVIRETNPTSLFVIENIELANRLYDYLSGDRIMIHRFFSRLEGEYWQKVTPESAVDDLVQRTQDARIEMYHTFNNEPEFYSSEEGRFLTEELVDWMVDAMHYAYKNSIKLAIGELAVAKNIREEDVMSGKWDSFLYALDAYRGFHIMTVHEYANAFLPTSLSNNSPSALLDKSAQQPDRWPESVDRGWRKSSTGEKLLPPFWHLLRVEWLQLRAQELGLDKLPYVVTECFWDDMQDMNRPPEYALDKLANAYNIDKVKGVNSLYSIWEDYYRSQGWSYSEAAMQQIVWADKIAYDEHCKGFNMFAWNKDWYDLTHDFSHPSLYELHELLIDYAQGNFDFVLDNNEDNNEDDSSDENEGDDVPDTINTLDYIMGDGRQYDVTYEFPGGPGTGIERMQTQRMNSRFFHVKGGFPSDTYNWEELWFTDNYIWRGTDTSPGNNEVYQLRSSDSPYSNNYGSTWIPRNMKEGQSYRNVDIVTFRKASDGSTVPEKPAYTFSYWIELAEIKDTHTFKSGITLNDVIVLEGYTDKGGQKGDLFERYYYAKNYGLVGWEDPTKGWQSYISRESVNQTQMTRKQLGWLDLPSLDEGEKVPESDDGWTRKSIRSSGRATNIRNKPSVSGSVVTTIAGCTPVKINTERAKGNTDNKQWIPVIVNNLYGYIREDVFEYCDPEVQTLNITIRYTPGDETDETLIEVIKTIEKIIKDRQ